MNSSNNGLGFQLQSGQPAHITRGRELLKRYPHLRELMGPYPLTAVYILMIVAGQFVLSWLALDFTWWQLLLMAYLVGAFLSHALYVLIHECTHNLVFKGMFRNKLLGIVCDFPQTLPSAMAFRHFHMTHHAYLGNYNKDPDIAPEWEAKLVGNSWWRKTIWMSFFSISQALRPLKLKNEKWFDSWALANIVIILSINILILTLLGPKALAYLFFSTWFALGLHPLGGRWIQEHYVTHSSQETYSYYGPINYVGFNIGYHNEHHDLMNISWVHLPKLKKIAPEFYTQLKSYSSLTQVLISFLFNPAMGPFSRVVYRDEHKDLSTSHPSL